MGLEQETKTTINTANVQRKRVPIQQIFFSFQTDKAHFEHLHTFLSFLALYDNFILQIFFF